VPLLVPIDEVRVCELKGNGGMVVARGSCGKHEDGVFLEKVSDMKGGVIDSI